MSDIEDVLELNENAQSESDGEKGIVRFFQVYANVFMLSLAIHAVTLFLVSLFNVENKAKKEHVVVLVKLEQPIDEEEKEEEVVEPEIVITEPEVTEEEVLIESEVVVEEEEVTETVSEVTEPTEVEAVQAGVSELADAPPAIMGVGSGSPAGGGLPQGYKSRSKAGRKGALARFGGAGTVSAVELALKWLAEHQEYDGSWDHSKYEGDWGGSRVGISSTALLAFLGAGYSETVGPFKKTVRKGVSWLNEQVAEEGDKPFFDLNYGTAMALMALSEATIFGSKPITRDNANKLVRSIGYSFNGSGWRYSIDPEVGETEQDMSVSSWVALSLKSAQAANLEAIEEIELETIFKGYKDYVERHSFVESGMAGYETPESAPSITMGWITFFAKQYLGYPKSDPFLKACSASTVEWIKGKGHGPGDPIYQNWQNDWFGGEKLEDSYAIYYGTIAAFQYQGEVWNSWNTKMKDALLRTQHKGNPKELGGSWDPDSGKVAQGGGRVMMTALMALCLEVYYRYEMLN